MVAAFDYNEQLNSLLGGRNPNQFARLNQSARKEIYRKALVATVQPITINAETPDDTFYLEPGARCMRQRHCMGRNDIGRILIKEATAIYYGENEWVVSSDHLEKFLYTDPHADGDTPDPRGAGQHVRKLTVPVNFARRTYGALAPSDSTEALVAGESPASADLMHLYDCGSAESIRIEIWGNSSGSPPDCEDASSRLKIHAVAVTVQGLMELLGKETLRVWKMCREEEEEEGPNRTRARARAGLDITHYWNEPSHKMMQRWKFTKGVGMSVAEVYRCEIQELVDEADKTLCEDDDSNNEYDDGDNGKVAAGARISSFISTKEQECRVA